MRPSREDEGQAFSEILAQALWLVEVRLLDAGVRRRDSNARLAGWRRLLQGDGLDDAVAQRAVMRLSTHGRGEKTLALRALARVERVSRALFELHQGLPALRAGSLAQSLTRAVDPDALAPLHPQLTWPDGTQMRWHRRPDPGDRELAYLLAAGTVDTHVHLGGAVPPAFHWVALMSGRVPFEVAGDVGTPDAGHAPRGAWVKALAHAARLRMRLAWRLQDRSEEPAFPDLPRSDDALWAPFRPPEEPCPDPDLVSPPTWLGIPGAVVALGQTVGARLRQDRAFTDPLAPSADALPLAGEGWLLYAVGTRLREARAARRLDHGGADERLALDLLRYLRLRNAFYRAMLHLRGTYGLARFGESFRRQSVTANRRRGAWRSRRRRRLRREYLRFERYRLAVAVHAHLHEAFGAAQERNVRPVRGIELRVSLWPGSSTLHRFRAWMRGLSDALTLARTGPFADHARSLNQRWPRLQVGFIVHAQKRAGLDADAARDAFEPLWRVLAEYPLVRPFFVGVDAAGAERDTPPRVFGEAFRKLRRRVDEHHACDGETPIRLGYTYHAGEDPWDLMTGLRHMDEAVELLLERRGRLGHALALGDDPAAFYLRRGGACEPTLATHLLDLAWAWGRCREAGLAPQALALAGRIGALLGTRPRTARLERCWRRMQPPRGARRPRQEDRLLGEFGLDQARWGRPVRVIGDAGWLQLVGEMQQLLRRRLASFGITIEANPTSNFLIGGYASFLDLPYRVLTDAGLAVSINTDDPGMFATSLPAEFQRLEEAYEDADRPRRDVLEWLAARARDGRASSFMGRLTPIGRSAWRAARRLLVSRPR